MWVKCPDIRNINIFIVCIIQIINYYFSSLNTASTEILHMPLQCVQCNLYLAILTLNCLTAPGLFIILLQKCDFIFRQSFFIFFTALLLSCFFIKAHCQDIFLHRTVPITFFPMPINKLSILWLEREIAISWCSTTYKTFYLLSVSITVLSLDFVQEVALPVSIVWHVCVQHA